MLFIGLSRGVRDHVRHYFIAITERAGWKGLELLLMKSSRHRLKMQ